MKDNVFAFLLSLKSNTVMIVIMKKAWGNVMYLDTSNVQSLKEKLLLCAVNEFAEYGYETDTQPGNRGLDGHSAPAFPRTR